jgi:hypothetical protein
MVVGQVPQVAFAFGSSSNRSSGYSNGITFSNKTTTQSLLLD